VCKRDTRTFFPEDGVALVPKRGCLLTLAYYAFHIWYGFGERRWNDILTGETRRTRRKTCPSATLSTTNPTWIDSGANPGLRGERPTTNDLSFGTPRYAYYKIIIGEPEGKAPLGKHRSGWEDNIRMYLSVAYKWEVHTKLQSGNLKGNHFGDRPEWEVNIKMYHKEGWKLSTGFI
jgi:hypothetical protein